MVERWKEGIRWFFVNAKVQGTADESLAPTPSALKLDEKLVSQIATSSASDAKQNYGNFGSEERIETSNPEEAAVLSVMRRRGMALRTERSYLSCYRDYSRRNRQATGKAY
jgi:hypothetical protein